MYSVNKKGFGWKLILGFLAVAVLLLIYLFIQVFNYFEPHTATIQLNCISNTPPYQCPALVYDHTTGNITVQLEQSTGTNWTSTSIFFIPQGTPTIDGTPVTIMRNGSGSVVAGGLNNNQFISITLAVSSPAVTAIGTSAIGEIWAKYTTSNGGPYYSELAKVNVKAT